ncbi:MAG: iron export ABC transporter permease subunit FetB [Hyphomicrobiaceae bacterium]
MTYHSLTLVDLGLAGLLLGLNALLSWGFRLGLERSLLIAAVRMALQLGAIGFVLKFVFEQGSPWLTAAFALMMIGVASWEAIARAPHRIGSGWQHWGLGTSALLFSGLVGTLYAVGLIIAADPWWTPRTLLPILGMVLGNALTGVSLVLDTVTTAVGRERPSIEARLALGATRFEAMRDMLSGALRTAMTPIINVMAAAGLVSLPGMMTGQILAGADPVDAARYQIMILCVIAGTTALGILLAGIGAVWLLTDNRHRLRSERLVATEKS